MSEFWWKSSLMSNGRLKLNEPASGLGEKDLGLHISASFHLFASIPGNESITDVKHITTTTHVRPFTLSSQLKPVIN